MDVRGHGRRQSPARTRTRVRGLVMVLAGILLLAFLLPGPHKPDSFSLTDPSTWRSGPAVPSAADSTRPEVDELASSDPESANTRPRSATRAQTNSLAESSRRSRPASDPPPALAEPLPAGGPRSPDREDENEDDEGLSIAGSVLDDSGEPLAGVAVEIGGGGGSVFTNELGMFLIEALSAGEYVLAVAESASHHGTRRTVRAGAQAADLHVQRKGSIEIFGRVQDTSGQPVANAIVRVLGGRQQSPSDASGSYAVQAELERAGTQPVLDFSHPDYRDVRKRVATNHTDLFTPVRLDVVLDSERDTAAVSGWVSGPRGEAVVAARISLSSQQPASFHSTVSDATGAFAFDRVEIASGYRIRVDAPERHYKRYHSSPFDVGPNGAVHEITLEPSDEAELSGTLVDLQGQPVPNFTIWLRNAEVPSHRSIGIHTDQSGHFEPVVVPAGDLQFSTRSTPSLSASGVSLGPGENRHILIPMDWGQEWLLGRVVDQQGEPVPRATVVAQWQQQFPEVRSSSRRETLTDLGGYFNFANLAAPNYQISVQADGFSGNRTQVALPYSGEFLVQLQRHQPPSGSGGE